jgi:hypothetical protein
MPIVDRSHQRFSTKAVGDRTKPAIVVHVRGQGLGSIAANPPYPAGGLATLPVTTAKATQATARLKSRGSAGWVLSAYYEAIVDDSHGNLLIFLDFKRTAGSVVLDPPPDQVVVTLDNTDPADPTNPNGTASIDDVSVPVDVVDEPACP